MKIRATLLLIAVALYSIPSSSQYKPAPPRPSTKPKLFTATVPNVHQNQLGWDASTDSTASDPGTVTVYKQAGPCPTEGAPLTNPTVLTTSAPPAGPYTDLAVAPGQTNCYSVAANIGGATSAQSNTVQLTTPIFPPTSLTGAAS
jgi:hypothetical protein